MGELTKTQIEELNSDINLLIQSLELEKKHSYKGELETESLASDFWNDTNRAKKVLSEIEGINREIETCNTLKESIDTLSQLFTQSTEEEQQSLLPEYEKIKSIYDSFQIVKFLNGKYDKGGCILSIHAGQGGTEADDWAQMLERMYRMYCDRVGYKYEIINYIPGTETGISSITMTIDGPYAFGKLKKEAGVHRLIRLSPFNAQNLRQTSFAGVEVIPQVDDSDNEIVIKDEDIEFKAVRAGGAGGQHVNKTSSAVQIKHIPTGISVHCSERRDQSQNKKTAMNILKAKLWQLEEEKRENELKNIKGEYKVAGWGNQIRNYVLHPYKLVKDLRTGIESSQPEDVLDGDLDIFIDSLVRLK